MIKNIQWQPLPDWCLVCTFPTCYSFCDKRKEVRGDYKEICRLFYSPLRIEVTEHNKKNYAYIIETAFLALKYLQANVNKQLSVSATDQTTKLSLSTGPDIVIVKPR